MRHAVMALIQQLQERPSDLPGGDTQGYDLSLNRTKELVHEEVEHRPPLDILAELRQIERKILAELRQIEQEILQGIEELEGMLR